MNSKITFVTTASSLICASLLLASCSDDPGSSGDGDGDGDGSGGEDAGTGGSSTGGADTGAGGTQEITYSTGYQTLRDVLSGYKIDRPDYSCASADCHSGGHDHSAVPLRLVQDEQLYMELLTHMSVKCGNIPVVDPGNPEGSALVKVLTEGCDENLNPDEEPIPLMPYGCEKTEWDNSCVADEYVTAIEEWILAGAPEF
jgi:hypothetical protein